LYLLNRSWFRLRSALVNDSSGHPLPLTMTGPKAASGWDSSGPQAWMAAQKPRPTGDDFNRKRISIKFSLGRTIYVTNGGARSTMPFIATDPDEVTTPTAVSYHEAGHLFVAYHYGLRIRQFQWGKIGGYWSGALANLPNAHLLATVPARAWGGKARMLLAGELAARMKTGLQTNQMVLPLNFPVLLNAATDLADVLEHVANDHHDAAKVLNIASDLGVPNWWNWFWTNHEATRQLLHAHWGHIEVLAPRLLAAKPADSRGEWTAGATLNAFRWIPFAGRYIYPRGTRIIVGQELIDFCHRSSMPLDDPDVVPQTFEE
jgi:hypothetical protein